MHHPVGRVRGLRLLRTGKAWEIALRACRDFLKNAPEYEMDILFAVLDETVLRMGRQELEKQS